MQGALYSDNNDDFSYFNTDKYALVQNEGQRKHILSRIDKNPKNFSPYDFDALYKIVLIGESNTGKTSMLLRFSDNIFSDNYLCTIGVDFKIKTLKVDDKIIKMQVWDTAGQERFRSISHAYYRNSHGCIAVYDIANRQSFDSIEEQILNFISYSPQTVASNIILVGNKTDLSEKRKVSFEEAVRLGKKLNLAAVYETSAKDNSSIDEAFFRAVVNCNDTYGANGTTSGENSMCGMRKSLTSSKSSGGASQIYSKRDSFESIKDDLNLESQQVRGQKLNQKPQSKQLKKQKVKKSGDCC